MRDRREEGRAGGKEGGKEEGLKKTSVVHVVSYQMSLFTYCCISKIGIEINLYILRDLALKYKMIVERL